MRTRNTKVLLAIRRDQRIQERFWSRVEREETEAGCWQWRGCLKPGGYPSLPVGQHSIAPSYLSWYWSTGELPLGGRLHQRCGNLLCIRPSHLAWIVGRHMESRIAAENDGYTSMLGVQVVRVRDDEPLPRIPRVLWLVSNPEETDNAVDGRNRFCPDSTALSA